jgi:hypothetical protein
MKRYVDLARSFTLVAPALGFVSGAATAYGTSPQEPWHIDLLIAPIQYGVRCAAWMHVLTGTSCCCRCSA